ncbi:MAG TPA: LpqB family beta-propeller domain-containing protein [Gemmatimonadales bacterium]|nr:LpqB family beta-propeller domain-containing protein [Gemmatimonadales bacterium]
MTLVRYGRTMSAVALTAVLCSRSAPGQGASRDAVETVAIRVHEGTTLSFDLSPDGRSIVFDLLGALWELPSAGGVARPLTDAVRDTAEDLDPSYSPDGRRIVFRAERRGRTGLWLLERGGAPLQLTQLPNPEGYEGNAAWSPDGRTIAYARMVPPDSTVPRWHSRLARIDLATREVHELPVAESVGPNLRDPAFQPGGTHLLVVAGFAPASAGGRIWMVESGSGRATPLGPATTEAVAPAFSPDGRRLAFFAPDSGGRTQLWVLSLDSPGAAAVRLTKQTDVTATRVRWTPDGRRLVYSADGRLWRIAATGGPPAEIPFTVSLSFERPKRSLPPARFPESGTAQSVRAFMGLALSPDGHRVAMLALGKLWVMPVGGAPQAIVDVPLSAHHLAWSADGATLAWSAGPWQEQDLFATEIATGSTHRITALPGREEYPSYSSDGRHLAFLYQPSEDTTILRVVDPQVRELSDAAQGSSLPVENGADVSWTPDADGLLVVSGGFNPSDSTRGTIIRLTGERRALARMPDSPLFLRWTANAIVFVRHARLWRAPFDSTGMRGPAEPLGAEPAMYASAADDGTVLFISDGGLHLRSPDGGEQRIGWPLSYTPPVAEPLLIRNARVIDGTGRPATAPRDLLVERGRISRIAAAGTLPAGSARVLDAGGRYLIPGLMDLHAHEYRPELLPGFAYFGVTTIRDQGSAIGPLVAYADAIAAGRMDGPRVDYGGFQFYSDWAYDAEDQQGVEPEADPDHVSRAVDMAQVFGSQHIKTRTFRRWDINARMIAEAHRRGMRATGHCAHPLPLVAAGMDAKEHAGFCAPRSDGLIYDDLVRLYRTAGISVVPTIAYSSFAVGLNEHPDLLDGDSALAPFLPPRSSFAWMLRLNAARRQQFAQFAQQARAATVKLARAGVTIGTGTDIWQIPTGVHLELVELVAAGLSPLEAIHAATGGAARIVGAEGDLGTIAVGKLADLVLLDADPLADIHNTRRIRAVIQAGRLVDRPGIVERFRHQ